MCTFAMDEEKMKVNKSQKIVIASQVHVFLNQQVDVQARHVIVPTHKNQDIIIIIMYVHTEKE